MQKITVLLICVLFYASVVPIVASTDEITEARIAGKNDAEGFKWKWFAASYMTTNASVIAMCVDLLDQGEVCYITRLIISNRLVGWQYTGHTSLHRQRLRQSAHQHHQLTGS